MRVERLTLGALETNCWIVSAGGEEPAVVIDPADDADAVLEAVGDRAVCAIVLTHAHFDHLAAAGDVLEATGAPLMVHEDDAERIVSDAPQGTGGALFGFHGITAPPADRVLRDGDTVESGALSLRVLHTPGHTQGCISLYAEDPEGGPPHLFSGDTLFAGSVGRTDFPGGDARTLSRSIASRIAPLPPETVVHPGHGPDTTVAREARINPFWPRT